MKVIITGATGTAGAEALRQAVLHPLIEKVTILTRRPLPGYLTTALPPPNPNPKLKVVIHKDYLSYPSDLLSGALRDHDAVLWDLGESSIGMSESDYTIITHDYAIAAAKAFSRIPRTSSNPFRFCFLSGQGSDQNEKSFRMYVRIKGRTEKDLALLADETPELTVFNFRPAAINPTLRDPHAGGFKEGVRNVLMNVLKPVGMVIDSSDLAKGMVIVAVEAKTGKLAGWDGKGESKSGDKGSFDNAEIKHLAKLYPTA